MRAVYDRHICSVRVEMKVWRRARGWSAANARVVSVLWKDEKKDCTTSGETGLLSDVRLESLLEHVKLLQFLLHSFWHDQGMMWNQSLPTLESYQDGSVSWLQTDHGTCGYAGRCSATIGHFW